MIEIVSATRWSEEEFWKNSALGLSLSRLLFDQRLKHWIAFENKKGLPEIFNQRIHAENDIEIIVFIHDDVWIDDFFLADRILDAVKSYDVFGVVGNKNRKHLQPSWAFINTSGTWDIQENLSGAVAHGDIPFGKVGYFGPSPAECDLLDGVLIAVSKPSLKRTQVQFDEIFDFHFYDVDFCITAQQQGLKIGTWPLAITHQSTGGYGVSWLNAYQAFCNKWDTTLPESDHVGQKISLIQDMKQTPAHNLINNELMAMIPAGTRRIVDVGCMHGQMALVYKNINPTVHYTGIDIDKDYAEVAKQHCDNAFAADIEKLNPSDWDQLFPSDCWIFGDCLEHLRDPWAILKKIRSCIDSDGCVLVCIPNAQHWGVQMRLLSGQFYYEDSGLLDRTHLRWFTRETMLAMFQTTGWAVAAGLTRTLGPFSGQEPALQGIRAFATACGLDPEMAVTDALPFQYMFKLVPA